MAKTKRPIAEVLMEAGVDGSTAEDIARIVMEFDIDRPTLADLRKMEGDFDPQAAIRDSRAAWWSNEGIPFEYKRLLDAKIENNEVETEAISRNLVEQWDASLGRFIAKGYLETPAALNTLERYYDHTSRIGKGPERPEFGTVNDVLKFYRDNSNSHDSLPFRLIDAYLDACLKAADRDISHVWRDEHGRWIDTPGVGDDEPKDQEQQGATKPMPKEIEELAYTRHSIDPSKPLGVVGPIETSGIGTKQILSSRSAVYGINLSLSKYSDDIDPSQIVFLSQTGEGTPIDSDDLLIIGREDDYKNPHPRFIAILKEVAQPERKKEKPVSFSLTPKQTSKFDPAEFREWMDAPEQDGADVMPHLLEWGRMYRDEHNPLKLTLADWDRVVKGHGLNTAERYGKFLGQQDLNYIDKLIGYHTLGEELKNLDVVDLETLDGFMGVSGMPMYMIDHEVFVKVTEGRTAEEIYSLKTWPQNNGEVNVRDMDGDLYFQPMLENMLEPEDLGLGTHIAIEGDMERWEGSVVHPKLTKSWNHFNNTGVESNTGKTIKYLESEAKAGIDAVSTKPYFTQDDRKEMKHSVVESLLDQPTNLGVDEIEHNYSPITPSLGEYKEVNEMIATWAHTSNDDDMRALGMQETVSEHFGVPLSPWQQELIDYKKSELATGEFGDEDEWMSDGTSSQDSTRYLFQDKDSDVLDVDAIKRAKQKQRHYLDRMYRNTQNYLFNRGVTHVRLYRGINIGDKNPGVSPGETIQIQDNALSSWSVNWRDAVPFAKRVEGGMTSGKYGTLVSIVVPAERILSTAHTGFGCASEGEVVLLGSNTRSYARVEYVHGMPSQKLWELTQERAKKLEEMGQSKSAKAVGRDRDISHVWRDERGRWIDTPGIGDDVPKEHPGESQGEQPAGISGETSPLIDDSESGIDKTTRDIYMAMREDFVNMNPSRRQVARYDLLMEGATESDLRAFGLYDPYVDPPNLLETPVYDMKEKVLRGEVSFDQYARWAHNRYISLLFETNDAYPSKDEAFQSALARLVRNSTEANTFGEVLRELDAAGFTPTTPFLEEATKMFPDTAKLSDLPDGLVTGSDISNSYEDTVSIWIANDDISQGRRDLVGVFDDFAEKYDAKYLGNRKFGMASIVLQKIIADDEENRFDLSLAEFAQVGAFRSNALARPEFPAAIRKIVANDPEVDGDLGKVLDIISRNDPIYAENNSMLPDYALEALLDGDTPIKHVPASIAVQYEVVGYRFRRTGPGWDMYNEALESIGFEDLKQYAERKAQSNPFNGRGRGIPRDVLSRAAHNTPDGYSTKVLNDMFIAPDGGRTTLGDEVANPDDVVGLYMRDLSGESRITLGDALPVLNNYPMGHNGGDMISYLAGRGDLTKGSWRAVVDVAEERNIKLGQFKYLREVVTETGFDGMTDEEAYKVLLAIPREHAAYLGDNENMDDYNRLLHGPVARMKYEIPKIETGEKGKSSWDIQHAFELSVMHTFMKGDNFEALVNDDVGQAKDSIVSSIANSTGIDYKDANGLVGQWSISSNGNDMRSLGIQVVAAETFGADLSPWQKEEIADAISQGKDKYFAEDKLGSREKAKDMIKAALLNMKKDTERLFAEKAHWKMPRSETDDPSSEPILLYRGVKVPRGSVSKDHDLGDTIAYEDNALSSWTTSEGVAEHFARTDFDDMDKEGVVIAALVPQDRILGNFRTGFGCMGEHEYVVIGAPGKQYGQLRKLYK